MVKALAISARAFRSPMNCPTTLSISREVAAAGLVEQAQLEAAGVAVAGNGRRREELDLRVLQVLHPRAQRVDDGVRPTALRSSHGFRLTRQVP